MRCPSCGTENEPDSRFCGGCGAKLVVESRVAPTAKISDDARYPTPVPSVPPSYAPAQSLPPQLPAPAAMPTPPPGSMRVPARAASPSPAMSDSLPVVKKRPVGLMVAVLIVDLGLAAAGGVLLAKGLGAKKSEAKPAPAQQTKTETAPAPVATGPAAAPGPLAAAAAAAPPAGSAAADPPPPPPEPPKEAAKPAKVDAKRAPAKKTTTATKSGGGGGSAPEDPYAPDLGAEIEQNAAASATEFQKCRDNAVSVAPVNGLIQMAFQVLPNGSIAHVTAVQNTTDSAWLASCLAGAMATWRFSPHAGKTLEFVRPFSYP